MVASTLVTNQSKVSEIETKSLVNEKHRNRFGENRWGQTRISKFQPDQYPFHETLHLLSFSIIPTNLCMGSSIFLLTICFSFSLVSSITYTDSITPNFTASHLQFVASNGAFLFSNNKTYKASIFNPASQQINFYLCVIHVASNTIIWSANRNAPISNSGNMKLTAEGLSIFDQDGNLKWSTPTIPSSVSGLRLTEMGNLLLLDQSNASLWESFNYPTDTIVIGQSLPVGNQLSCSVSDSDLSSSYYNFSVTASDAILQWYGQTYWKLSMDPEVYRNANYMVENMAINATGLYLLGRNGSLVVVQLILSPADFRIAKVDSSGQFTVSSFSASSWKHEFAGPFDSCRIPLFCGQVGLCTEDGSSNAPTCSCPPNFRTGSKTISGCVPSDNSYSLASSCNSTDTSSLTNSSSVSYLGLGSTTDYFATAFTEPVEYGVNLSTCEDLCSKNCSCLGIFFGNSSGSCYMLVNMLGSMIFGSTNGDDLVGYVKAVGGSSPPNSNGNKSKKTKQSFPIAAQILLPFTVGLLLVTLCFIWRRRRKFKKEKELKLGHVNSISSGDLDGFFIPGLPKRFDYQELEVITDNFKTQIGSGGFGAVFKGSLHDRTVVAVKKITNLGVQGKKEFCTEIAVIGNIHHVNLVKLKGFCAHGRQRLLVYEYMNRGSLDRTLFGHGPILEWQERFDIALGTARGLAYLHGGCEHKIIHCDIKPENILLHDPFQIKISDFGLSKLLGPEQSSLFTTMRGTRGYLAPEWLTNSAISEKTDVYSFGMVLLELVSGRKNCSVRSQGHSLDDNRSSGGNSSSSSGLGLVYFPLFALEMHEQGRYLELADPRLEGRVRNEEVEKLVRISLCCVHEEPALRPSMVTVVGMLEGGIPLTQPRMECLNFLRFYGRRFTEVSTIGEEMEQNDVNLYLRANYSPTSTSGSHNYYSYMSSQQVSGPR